VGRPSDQSLPGAWIALGGAWIVIAAALLSPPSARINGVQIAVAFMLALLYGALFRRRRRAEESHGIQEWAVLVTVLVAVVTLDYAGLGTEGVILNTSPLAVLILLALRGR